VIDRPRTYVPVTIADGLRAAAARAPEKLALEESGRQLTFAQLVERVHRAANGIGLPRGSHAAIFSPNCLEFVEIACGLAAAGVAPALINARSSPAEVAYLCDDSEARVLFVHESLEDVARAAELSTVERIILIGRDYEEWLRRARPTRPDVELEEWEDFLLPYTAGTTGRAKGVRLSHRARVLTFFAMAAEYGCYGPDDSALAIAPLFHGGGFSFAAATLFFGGTCIVLPRFDAEETLRLLAERRLTNVFMVPTHFNAIFALGEETLRRHRPTGLRSLISNAAPLSQVMKERIVEYFGDGLLYESYGSTEASLISTLRPADQLRKQHCVGQPFPATSISLVGDDGDDAPVGEVGEVVVRSPYLFNGYWNRPEETERAFRDGWLATGDLGRRDEEGYLYLVDRRDDKIVSGGVNIYPREIEEVLARHPAVLEVAVFGVPDDHWGEAVHAVVVTRAGAEVSADELLRFGEAQQLARYKLPKGIGFAPALPRNAAGKVLRRELREPFWAGSERRIS
jgi:acyl-CoA synthetase (AMP-forming)/AMP-acid ligase II